MRPAPGSFRDPCGRVVEADGEILRLVFPAYERHWEKVLPFLREMTGAGLVLPFEEITPVAGSWKTIRVQRLPFVSFPHEWCFDQLRDAALLTLELQRRALRVGLILKDASAYNVQFTGAKPVFIDHLSFEILEEGRPWMAYRQFCSHFLAPLAVCRGVDERCGLLSRLWMDGIPLELAASMLPWTARFNFGLLLHLFFHAKAQVRYSDTQAHAERARAVRVSKTALINLAGSLERCIAKLKAPLASDEWSGYYGDTNYSSAARSSKRDVIDAMLGAGVGSRNLAVDLGANTGGYSAQLARHYALVLAVDSSASAIGRHYLNLKKDGIANILPLVMDAANPSPGLGFLGSERPGFLGRCRADCVAALALVHHLRFAAGIPLAPQAEFFAGILREGGSLIIEFVPKTDSQAQRLLALRRDAFPDYELECFREIFGRRFAIRSETRIEDSERVLFHLERNGAE